jgi:hypothetical protein
MVDHVLTFAAMITTPVVMEHFGAGAVPAAIFFLALGIFQLIWIGVFLKSNNSSLLVLGVLGNLLSILVYFVSVAGVTLFGVPPQPFFAQGIIAKVLETIFVLASIYVLKAAKHSQPE